MPRDQRERSAWPVSAASVPEAEVPVAGVPVPAVPGEPSISAWLAANRLASARLAVPVAFSELFGWLASQGITPAGPPFIRYLVIDMAGELQVEMAVPVAAQITASGRIQPGTLPGGRYAVLRHTGPYDGLIASNAALLRWGQEQGIEFDTWDTAQGSAWRSRAEHYLTDPSQEPDPAKLETDVAFLIA